MTECKSIWLMKQVSLDSERISSKQAKACVARPVRWHSELWDWQKASAADGRMGPVSETLLRSTRVSEFTNDLSLWVKKKKGCWLRARHTGVLKTSERPGAHELGCLLTTPLSATSCIPFPHEYKESFVMCKDTVRQRQTCQSHILELSAPKWFFVWGAFSFVCLCRSVQFRWVYCFIVHLCLLCR